MYLLDSNIIIYSCIDEYVSVKTLLFSGEQMVVSKISKIESLGFPGLSAKDKKWLEYLFEKLVLLDLSDKIVNRAISLKQASKIKLADSIIAASALEYNLTLVTNNTADFKNVDGLQLLNPIKQ